MEHIMVRRNRIGSYIYYIKAVCSEREDVEIYRGNVNHHKIILITNINL
jgi:hypothetical protein